MKERTIYSMAEFQGFSMDVFDLWLDICLGSEPDAEAMKEKYKACITEPLTRLYNRLLPSVRSISDDFDLVPSRCISSPYTDMRFSRGQKYKTYMYLRFKQRRKENDVFGLYFDMGSEFYSYGFRVYKQTSEGVKAAKEKIKGNMARFSEWIDSTVEHGFEIYGEDYKKDHFPDLEASNAKRILNKKGFYIGKRVKLNENVFSPALADEIAEGFFCVSEIYNFLKT